MKRFSLLIASVLLFGNLFSQFRADVKYLTFYIPGDTCYLEIQYLIPGNALLYVPTENGKYQGTVFASVSLHPDGSAQQEAVYSKNMRFITDEYADNLSEGKNDNYFLTRIPLPKGAYTLYVCLKDNNREESKPLCFSDKVTLPYERGRVSMSGIQTIAAVSQAEQQTLFSKNGLDIIPYFSNFYPEEVESLIFMQEIYNTDRQANGREPFKVITYISEEKGQTEVLPYKKVRHFNPTDKFVLLSEFNLNELPSGNYYLHVDAYDSKERLLCGDSLFFQRSNPSVDKPYSEQPTDTLSKDTLLQYVDYLLPIAQTDEVDFIRAAKRKDYDTLADFFYRFWKRRSPDDPWDAWYTYFGNVKRVNYNYTTLRLKGYKSDRGHYYLKYGAPDEIEYYPLEEGLYPYEIWRYYQLADQTDVYFIFGNLDLATKEFRMICSNKKDEIYDPRWKLRLKPKDKRPFSIEETE